MIASFQQDMIVQDIVRTHRGGAWVFRRLGIDPNDTCTLNEAASKKGLPIELLMAALDRTAAVTGPIGQADDDKFQATLLDVIIEHIEERHHVFLRSELPRLEELLNKAIKAHYRRHGGRLGALKTVFLSFKTSIEEHLSIEEEILFPQLRNIKRGTAGREPSAETPGRSSPIGAIQEMKHEHELVEWALNEMMALTSDYTLPDDAPDVLITLYEGLVRIEADLQMHVHLENDLLWPVRLIEQTPVDVTVATSPAAYEENLLCPLTNQPCEAGSPAACSRFWDCIRKAMEQRWAKVDGGSTDRGDI